jgi:hypothetical protein
MGSRQALARWLVAAALAAPACSRAPLPPLPVLPTAPAPVSYREVQPVLEQRCVVCHGCYDAPCQLLLSSHAGIERGGTKEPVYSASRLVAKDPTRLGIDAQATAQWRERGFFSVLEGSGQQALLLRMLALGRAHPIAAGEKLPAEVALEIDRPLHCPATGAEFEDYERRQPQGGMPYGTAPLADAELGLLAAWVVQGAPGAPAPPPPPAAARAQVARWEEFLNGDSPKQRLVARYLYEHWFLAHLQLEGLPAGPFYRIVRSRTAPGAPAEELATRRPTDDPGAARFWYRLVPLDEAIVRKTHIVYPLGDARLRRLAQLFLEPAWEPTRLPAYGADATNPFTTFAEIPARSRYQFLLDDAGYFVMTFIRGPVCRGQVAVDVIEDHFFIAFLDPDHDLAVQDPAFLARAAPFLELPAEHGDHLIPGEIWLRYSRDQRRYLDLREAAYDAADPARRGPNLDFLWDGDGRNRNALLTVFRHYDNAAVELGYVGAIPKTAWVIDYPLLERIYYDLVAGFDVFGNVLHQVSTRLYMDHLRMQSENLFLGFLPEDRREAIRASWYVGATRQLDYTRVDTMRSLGHATQIRYATDDPKAELIQAILARSPAVSGPPDLLNRCGAPPCDRPGATAVERRAERALQPLAGVRGPFVAPLPELSFLRVRSGAGLDADVVYSLARNTAHTNVASMFDEAERLVPADDTLTIARGTLGSYPNFFFDVELAQVEAFASALAAIDGPPAFEALVRRFGVRRSSPRFWEDADFFHAELRRRDPGGAGLFDLARYVDP